MGVWVYDRGGGLVFAESQPTKHPPTPIPNYSFSLLVLILDFPIYPRDFYQWVSIYTHPSE